MRLSTSYYPKMIHKEWKVKPILILKVGGKLHSIGLYFRFGWRYLSVWVSV